MWVLQSDLSCCLDSLQTITPALLISSNAATTAVFPNGGSAMEQMTAVTTRMRPTLRAQVCTYVLLLESVFFHKHWRVIYCRSSIDFGSVHWYFFSNIFLQSSSKRVISSIENYIMCAILIKSCCIHPMMEQRGPMVSGPCGSPAASVRRDQSQRARALSSIIQL